MPLTLEQWKRVERRGEMFLEASKEGRKNQAANLEVAKRRIRKYVMRRLCEAGIPAQKAAEHVDSMPLETFLRPKRNYDAFDETTKGLVAKAKEMIARAADAETQADREAGNDVPRDCRG